MSSRALVSVTALLLAALASAADLQPKPPQGTSRGPLRVAVSSVKQNKSDEPGPQFSPYGDGARIRGITVQLMLQIVYNVQSFQIVGGPSWMRSDRFDIVATLEDANGNPAGRRLPDLLRGVLSDRFSLRSHLETREGTTYALDVAPGGPKLVPAAGLRPMFASAATGYLSGTMDLSNLSDWLTWRLERPVVNRTALVDAYDIELVWQPDVAQATGTRLPAPVPPRPPNVGPASLPPLPMRTPPPPNPSAPSIFTAIQEQLGLKLTSEKSQVEMLLIDALQRPSLD
jgi:uncharacterized protein (TIGR03435 family)